MRMAPGLVPQEQLVFLDSVLVHRKIRDEPVIFVNHYPLDESLANWYKVIDLLKTANIQATLLGHGHTNRLYHFEGIPGIMGRSNLQTKKAEVGYNLVTIKQDTMYYAERLSSGKTLRFGAKCQSGQTPVVTILPETSMLPFLHIFPKTRLFDESKVSNIRAIWNIQEMSDIGSGISARKNRAVYANTAGDIVAVDLSSGTKIWSYPTGGKSTPHLRSMEQGGLRFNRSQHLLSGPSIRQLIWMHPTIKPIVACCHQSKPCLHRLLRRIVPMPQPF